MALPPFVDEWFRWRKTVSSAMLREVKENEGKPQEDQQGLSEGCRLPVDERMDQK